MSNRDIVAIGTSAGGLDALRFVASKLSVDFPASILMVMHLPEQARPLLDAILTRAGPLPATFAADGEWLERGRIYLAPPACHLLMDGEQLRLGTGPRENNSRPAIDPLFRSAALCCGPRTIGGVLTGTLGDGAAGLVALQRSGGLTVVQDPSDAAYAEMPATALEAARPDHVESLAGIPPLLEKLVRLPAGEPAPVAPGLADEVDIARGGQGSMSQMDRIGRRSVLACPDCHGVMWEIDEDELVRYRCHVGHAYTAELMSLALDENLTRALASALRALDERIAVAGKLHKHAIENGRTQTAELWLRRMGEYEHEANVIREAAQRTGEIALRRAAE